MLLCQKLYLQKTKLFKTMQILDYTQKYPGIWEARPLSDIKYIGICHAAFRYRNRPIEVICDEIDKWHRENGWCFPLDTEILTSNGWKNYHDFDIENDLVARHNDDNSINFIKARNIIFNEQDTIAEVNTMNQSVAYSLSHKIYASSNPGMQKKVLWGDELQRAGVLYFKCAGMLESEGDNDPDLYRLIAFIVADGYLSKNNGIVNGIGIDIDKQRKVDYIIPILERLGVKFSFKVYQYKERIRHRIRILKESYDKLLSFYFSSGVKELSNDLINLPLDCRLAIIEAYTASDGWDTTHSKNMKKYQIASTMFSSIKQNVDVLQILATISGMRTVLKTNTVTTNYSKIGEEDKPKYVITLVSNKDEACVDLRNQEVEYYESSSWCIDIEDKRFFVRRKGKVQITYNSCVSYHFVIAQNGDIAQCNDLDANSYTTGNSRPFVVCICLDADFENYDQPALEQLQSLEWLIQKLGNEHPEFPATTNDVYGDNELSTIIPSSYTKCPGKNLTPLLADMRANGRFTVLDKYRTNPIPASNTNTFPQLTQVDEKSKIFLQSPYLQGLLFDKNVSLAVNDILDRDLEIARLKNLNFATNEILKYGILGTNKYYRGLLNDTNINQAISDLIDRTIEVNQLKAKNIINLN
jgi:hypothetical protein